jgi:exosortase
VETRWWNVRAATLTRAPSHSVRRLERLDLLAVLSFAALALAYAPLLRQLAHAWRVDPYAGHGMFVPAYSALLLWIDRQRLASTPRAREPLGLLVVVGALASLWAGRSIDSVVVQGLSLVLAVAGVVLGLFGARRLRAAAFPIAFLAFMLPLPRGVVDRITLDVQTFHAHFTSVAMGIMGVPHLQRGISIELPNVSLIVAEGCNGLRFLMALVTLAAVFAHVSQRTRTRKLLLVALAVPLAVLANGFRVSALSLAAYYVGPYAAEGLTHHSIGKTVWVLTLGVLFALGMLLRRGTSGRGPHPPPAQLQTHIPRASV